MTYSSTVRLFTTHHFSGRLLYKLYFSIYLAGIFSLLYYRLSHFPADHRLLWLLLSAAELWFAVMWLFEQSFRWEPTYHVTHQDRLPPPADLPPIDIMVCTADADREPPSLVANTLLSVMAYDYEVNKLAYYLSDDGGSELMFHAAFEASNFARDWLPFCRKYDVESPAPLVFFSSENSVARGSGEDFRRDYDVVKKKFDEMQERLCKAAKNGTVPKETRGLHKGFSNWDTPVHPRDHPPIVEVLLKGNGGDMDVVGKPLPPLVYVSREKRHSQPHHFKAGALNALNRVSGVMSNAPFILNVDCDMYSNNSKTLYQTMCFFLDPKESHQIALVEYPQSFIGLTPNDLYAAGFTRTLQVEFYGTNSFNGPLYGGTGAIIRREALDGKKLTPKFQPNLDIKPVSGGNARWGELEEKAKALTSCTYEKGKAWGKEIGIMYGCPTEDVFTGLALHSRGWRSVFVNPERKAFLGLSPRNVNDTLIQNKRWATGLFEVFLSRLCPFTHGIGRLKWGQIMQYGYFTLWAPWSLPILCYALLPPLALTNGIYIFPKGSDPWFKLFVFLGIAPHAYNLGELIWAKGTVKMWWNENRMWMMKGVSSFLIALLVVMMKSMGLSESGFEITSKVMDNEAVKRYKKEVLEFGVASPMFVPPTTLSLLNLYSLLKSIVVAMKGGTMVIDQMALQIVLSSYVSLISLPLYEAMFLRRDRGRIPMSITIYSSVLALALLFLLSPFI